MNAGSDFVVRSFRQTTVTCSACGEAGHNRRTCELTREAADDITTRFNSYIREENTNNLAEDEAEFFENYEDALCVYNETWEESDEEIADDPDEMEEDTGVNPLYHVDIDDILF